MQEFEVVAAMLACGFRTVKSILLMFSFSVPSDAMLHSAGSNPLLLLNRSIGVCMSGGAETTGVQSVIGHDNAGDKT